MKQYITEKQIDQLSEKGKNNYWKSFWLVVEGTGISYIQDHNTGLHYYKDSKNPPLSLYPRLSIGQMIEFIDIFNNSGAFATEWTIKIHRKGRSKQKEWVGKYSKNIWLMFGEGSDVTISNNELCDALWEAVKIILEK